MSRDRQPIHTRSRPFIALMALFGAFGSGGPITGVARAEPAAEDGLASILAEAAEDSRVIRLTGSSLLAVSGLAGLIGGSIWASDGDALGESPVPLLLLTASGNALLFGVLGLVQPSELERLDARLSEEPASAIEVERELMAHARIARRERVAGGIVATVLGAGVLGAGVWYGLEEEDAGVAFISGMGLGIVGSLGLGAGIGLLTNTSTAEDTAEDVRAWRRARAVDGPASRGLVLQPPALSVSPGGVWLTVGGTF